LAGISNNNVAGKSQRAERGKQDHRYLLPPDNRKIDQVTGELTRFPKERFLPRTMWQDWGAEIKDSCRVFLTVFYRSKSWIWAK